MEVFWSKINEFFKIWTCKENLTRNRSIIQRFPYFILAMLKVFDEFVGELDAARFPAFFRGIFRWGHDFTSLKRNWVEKVLKSALLNFLLNNWVEINTPRCTPVDTRKAKTLCLQGVLAFLVLLWTVIWWRRRPPNTKFKLLKFITSQFAVCV